MIFNHGIELLNWKLVRIPGLRIESIIIA
jgi:hypothetical protein